MTEIHDHVQRPLSSFSPRYGKDCKTIQNVEIVHIFYYYNLLKSFRLLEVNTDSRTYCYVLIRNSANAYEI